MTILDLSCQPQHIETIAVWHCREWAHLNPGDTLAKRIDRMRDYLSTDLIPSTYVCLQQGELAGSAALVACDMDTRPDLTPWLASVYVAPEFRRRGIGGRLVRHVMLQAESAGLTRLYLFTPDQEAFYRRLGWQPFALENYRGCEVTLMQVTLSERPAPSAVEDQANAE